MIPSMDINSFTPVLSAQWELSYKQGGILCRNGSYNKIFVPIIKIFNVKCGTYRNDIRFLDHSQIGHRQSNARNRSATKECRDLE